MREAKKVAAIVTEYRHHSHADVIIGKLIEGYNYDGGAGPNLKLVSMYVDQFPPKDMSRPLAKKYGFRLYDSIAGRRSPSAARTWPWTASCASPSTASIRPMTGADALPAQTLLRGRMQGLREEQEVGARLQRQAPGRHLGRRQMDVRPLRRVVRARAGRLLHPVDLAPARAEAAQKHAPGRSRQSGYGPTEGYGFHSLEGLQCLASCARAAKGRQGRAICEGEEMWKASIWDAGRRRCSMRRCKLVMAHAKGEVPASRPGKNTKRASS